MIVADAGGRVLAQTASAERLFDVLDGRADWRGPIWQRRVLPEAVRGAIRALAAVDPGQFGKTTRIVRRTRLGLVTVEAMWLRSIPDEAVDTLADRHVVVQIGLNEHAAICAARALRAGGATPAQIRVGVLLVTGQSKPEISRALGIKESSVQDAARKLYIKLGVRNATELGMQLWLGSDPGWAAVETC